MNPIHVVAISDMHGHLPTNLPQCDLLLIGGDICPLNDHSLRNQASWLETEFSRWLNRQPAKHIVGTWGNHDFVGESAPHLIPKMSWHLLVDEAIELLGVKVYGTPWQPRFFDWAFNLDEPELERKWARIPDDTDILVLHGPPRGFGDIVGPNKYHPQPEHTGSPSLTARIRAIRPQLVIAGHIHESYGVYDMDGVVIANVSLVNHRYQMVHKPFQGVVNPRLRS